MEHMISSYEYCVMFGNDSVSGPYSTRSGAERWLAVFMDRVWRDRNAGYISSVTINAGRYYVARRGVTKWERLGNE